jgi:hypothetical protein
VLSKRPIDTDEILAVDMRETGKMDCTMGLDDIPLLMAQCTSDSFMYVLIDLSGIARERERERATEMEEMLATSSTSTCIVTLANGNVGVQHIWCSWVRKLAEESCDLQVATNMIPTLKHRVTQ